MSGIRSSSAAITHAQRYEPRPRKSAQTREAILASALAFLETRPFRELTVGELMGRVGASRPTFYQYFADLYELMGVLLDNLRNDVLEAARPWFVGEGDPLPHLRVRYSST